MTGKLTTHVLDTANGCPAANLQLTLWTIDDAASPGRSRLRTTVTNRDGRVDEPLLQGAEFNLGVYELIFAVGAYFQQQGMMLPQPNFLDEVPLRFGVADADAHYHVPLLVSPWSYSTYRGS
ncbi:MAG: hydroxyisourate hydrolase [Leptolyngbyaceae cyanobacterium]